MLFAFIAWSLIRWQKININWSIETCSGVSKQINEKLIKGNCYSIYLVICLPNLFHLKEKFISERQITGELEYVIYFWILESNHVKRFFSSYIKPDATRLFLSFADNIKMVVHIQCVKGKHSHKRRLLDYSILPIKEA